MRFYTWKDIERYILMHHDEWKDELYDIEVIRMKWLYTQNQNRVRCRMLY